VIIHLITPAPLSINNGNKMTALRWARLLRSLGHKVVVRQSYDGGHCDLLIALHARRSYRSVQKFQRIHPDLPLIVALTGTDLYRDIHSSRNANRSLELCTRLVVLQKQALAELPARFHAKTRVIYQSAERYHGKTPEWEEPVFKVCVIGHLRKEKDPLRTALAARRLPANSRIKVLHIGLALDDRLARRARAEARANPRYRWVGEWPHWKTRRALAESHLLSLTSEMEGSSNVLSEALSSSVPIVASRIPGLMGTLGKNFPGYFSLGDTTGLAAMLFKCESEPRFYQSLKRHCERVAGLVDPQRELDAWRHLIGELEKQGPSGVRRPLTPHASRSLSS